MSNKKKIILTSVITIATCLAIITGSTFALFTSETPFNVAITAGNLKVTATPVDTNNDGIDFVLGTEIVGKLPIGTATFEADTNEVVIEKMVPGDYVTFQIEVKNEGNIAANCDVKFEKKELTATDSPADMPAANINKLWNALEAKVVDADGNDVFGGFVKISGNEFTNWTADGIVLAPNDATTITITIRFPNSTTAGYDNQFINTNCAFTYSVYAEQYNEDANP